MTTTFIDFVTPTTTPFSFQATLDSAVYTATLLWNIFGQRYYVLLKDNSGNVIFNLPLIGSPPDYDISLTAGYFTTKLVWRVQNTQFEVID